MSYVTNAILTWGANGQDELDEKWLKEVNDFINDNSWYKGDDAAQINYKQHGRGFVEVQDYGGTKALECFIAIGAFNYLNDDELVEFLRTRDWFDVKDEYGDDESYLKESLQLIIKEQHDNFFRIIDIFPGGELPKEKIEADYEDDEE